MNHRLPSGPVYIIDPGTADALIAYMNRLIAHRPLLAEHGIDAPIGIVLYVEHLAHVTNSDRSETDRGRWWISPPQGFTVRTVTEYAQRHDVRSPRTVRRMCRDGRLVAHQHGEGCQWLILDRH